jgi:hypothetical protein
LAAPPNNSAPHGLSTLTTGFPLERLKAGEGPTPFPVKLGQLGQGADKWFRRHFAAGNKASNVFNDEAAPSNPMGHHCDQI